MDILSIDDYRLLLYAVMKSITESFFGEEETVSVLPRRTFTSLTIRDNQIDISIKPKDRYNIALRLTNTTSGNSVCIPVSYNWFSSCSRLTSMNAVSVFLSGVMFKRSDGTPYKVFPPESKIIFTVEGDET